MSASSAPPYRVAPVPGKGDGLLATRDIAPGEVVLLEQPLFTVGALRSEESIARLVQNLSDQDREAFFSLTSRPDIDGQHLAIFENNVIDHGNGEGGLFLLASKINHSCRPNLIRFWAPELGAVRLVASQPVRAGEELTIYYVDPVQPRKKRQEELMRKFNFTCTCAACSLVGDELAASDKRCDDIQEVIAYVPTLVNRPDVLLLGVRFALPLLEEENLQIYRAMLAYDAFNACIGWSDLENAKKWIAKALEYKELEVGKDAADYKRYKELLEDPTKHIMYGCMGEAKLIGPE
ncbi:hypothetical protein JCM8097_008773 [Rhodosporidiobolus ruineniae]